MQVRYTFDPTGNDAHDRMIILFFEKIKYQTLWELRKFEEEDAIITFYAKEGKEGFEVLCHSIELEKQISDLVHSFYRDFSSFMR